MKAYKFDLLKMRHARLLSAVTMHAACGNTEIMSAAIAQAKEIENEIEKAFSSTSKPAPKPAFYATGPISFLDEENVLHMSEQIVRPASL